MIYARMDAKTLKFTCGIASSNAIGKRLDYAYYENDNGGLIPKFDAVVMFFNASERREYMEMRLLSSIETKYRKYIRSLAFRRKSIMRDLESRGYSKENHCKNISDEELRRQKEIEKGGYEEL